LKRRGAISEVIADIAERLDGVKQLLGAAKLAVDGLDSENSEDCTCVGRLLTLICDEVELAKEGVGTAFPARTACKLPMPVGFASETAQVLPQGVAGVAVIVRDFLIDRALLLSPLRHPFRDVRGKNGQNMGLKPCPECGHQVSSKAVTCPNCGCELVSSFRARYRLTWIGFAWVAVFIIVILILVVVYSHNQ
jgi:predicted nucleic acid-binding Zn ribbon protein